MCYKKSIYLQCNVNNKIVNPQSCPTQVPVLRDVTVIKIRYPEIQQDVEQERKIK